MNNNPYDYKYEIALGALSGFDPCCIAWYFLRNKITYKSRWRYLIEFLAFDKYSSGYIPCPYHSLIKDKSLIECNKCHWKQLYEGPCRLCLLKKNRNDLGLYIKKNKKNEKR